MGRWSWWMSECEKKKRRKGVIMVNLGVGL